MEPTEIMRTEWQAWLGTNEELKKLGLDWNDPKAQAFHASILIWGESLADLRITQDYDVRRRARRDAEGLVRLAKEA